MNVSPERIVRIFALGSPHGDDQVAWVIAERLAQDAYLRPLIHVLSTPWDLVELVVPGCSIIVIDACVPGAATAVADELPAPGTVLRFGASELVTAPFAKQSTHGGSLIESIQLAKSLQREIRELAVFAVAAESCEAGAALSESARCAVDDVTQQVQLLLSEWLPKR